MVLADLVADLITPLLTITLQLLPVFDATGTIIGQVLSTCARRTGSSARPANARCSDASSGTTAGLQELACGTPSA